MNNLSKAGPSSTSIYAVRAALTYPSAIKLRTSPSPLGKREQSWWQIELCVREFQSSLLAGFIASLVFGL
jgi:hypothetical protein